MIRFFLIFLIIGVAVWLGLHQCTGIARNTLVVKPAASFPREKNQLLGQSMARAIPRCPGFQKLGAVLEFTDLTEEADAITLHFSSPDSPDIPLEWRARGLRCAMRLSDDALSLGSVAGCQALCLGEPGVDGMEMRKSFSSGK